MMLFWPKTSFLVAGVTLGHSSPDMVYRANSMLLRSLTGHWHSSCSHGNQCRGREGWRFAFEHCFAFDKPMVKNPVNDCHNVEYWLSTVWKCKLVLWQFGLSTELEKENWGKKLLKLQLSELCQNWIGWKCLVRICEVQCKDFSRKSLVADFAEEAKKLLIHTRAETHSTKVVSLAAR